MKKFIPYIKTILLLLALGVLIFVISLVEELTQISRYQHYWDKNNQKPAVTNQILYVALGDSTAQGIGATAATKGYVGLVAEDISNRKGRPVQTINLSKSGAKTEDVLNTQLPKLEKLTVNQETVVTMAIGANDMMNFDANAFTKNMDQIMQRLPKQTLIADIPYFGGTRYASNEKNVEKANDILYVLALKHGFLPVQLHAKTRKNSSFMMIAPDRLHPSSDNYSRNWLPVFADRLQ